MDSCTLAKPEPDRVTILVVDDHPEMRQIVRVWLHSEPDMLVVGEADDGITALLLAEQLHPDVMLIDLRMPDLDGITTVRRLRLTHPGTAVIVHTADDDSATRAQAESAGASAFASKNSPISSLPDIIRSARGRYRLNSLAQAGVRHHSDSDICS